VIADKAVMTERRHATNKSPNPLVKVVDRTPETTYLQQELREEAHLRRVETL
jgi:hypothetical protein